MSCQSCTSIFSGKKKAEYLGKWDFPKVKQYAKKKQKQPNLKYYHKDWNKIFPKLILHKDIKKPIELLITKLFAWLRSGREV